MVCWNAHVLLILLRVVIVHNSEQKRLEKAKQKEEQKAKKEQEKAEKAAQQVKTQGEKETKKKNEEDEMDPTVSYCLSR